MAGTKVFCPNCDRYTVCEALPINESPNYRGKPRPHKSFLGGSKAFLRYRECNECRTSFLTGELPLAYIERASSVINEVKSIVDKHKI